MYPKIHSTEPRVAKPQHRPQPQAYVTHLVLYSLSHIFYIIFLIPVTGLGQKGALPAHTGQPIKMLTHLEKKNAFSEQQQQQQKKHN